MPSNLNHTTPWNESECPRMGGSAVNKHENGGYPYVRLGGNQTPVIMFSLNSDFDRRL